MTKYNRKEMIWNAMAHKRSNMHNIFQAYGNPSTAKVNAWEYCERLCEEYGGWDLKVIAKNTFKFSAGFYFINSETGALCFCYITDCYDRYSDDARVTDYAMAA